MKHYAVLDDEGEDEEMEMPTPCARCSKVFELTEGKGFEDITYCHECGSFLNEKYVVESQIEDFQCQIECYESDLKDAKEELEIKKEELRKLNYSDHPFDE